MDILNTSVAFATEVFNEKKNAIIEKTKELEYKKKEHEKILKRKKIKQTIKHEF